MKMKAQKFNAVRDGMLTAGIVRNDACGYATGDVVKVYMVDTDGTTCPDDYIYIRITHIVTHDDNPDALAEGYMMICFERAII